jgi:hypothetical protein
MDGFSVSCNGHFYLTSIEISLSLSRKSSNDVRASCDCCMMMIEALAAGHIKVSFFVLGLNFSIHPSNIILAL